MRHFVNNCIFIPIFFLPRPPPQIKLARHEESDNWQLNNIFFVCISSPSLSLSIKHDKCYLASQFSKHLNRSRKNRREVATCGSAIVSVSVSRRKMQKEMKSVETCEHARSPSDFLRLLNVFYFSFHHKCGKTIFRAWISMRLSASPFLVLLVT